MWAQIEHWWIGWAFIFLVSFTVSVSVPPALIYLATTYLSQAMWWTNHSLILSRFSPHRHSLSSLRCNANTTWFFWASWLYSTLISLHQGFDWVTVYFTTEAWWFVPSESTSAFLYNISWLRVSLINVSFGLPASETLGVLILKCFFSESHARHFIRISRDGFLKSVFQRNFLDSS